MKQDGLDLAANASDEEHKPAEEAADPGCDDIASAMKQDENSLATDNQVAGLIFQSNDSEGEGVMSILLHLLIKLLARMHKSLVNPTIASVSKARAADDLYPSPIVSSIS